MKYRMDRGHTLCDDTMTIYHLSVESSDLLSVADVSR